VLVFIACHHIYWVSNIWRGQKSCACGSRICLIGTSWRTNGGKTFRRGHWMGWEDESKREDSAGLDGFANKMRQGRSAFRIDTCIHPWISLLFYELIAAAICSAFKVSNTRPYVQRSASHNAIFRECSLNYQPISRPKTNQLEMRIGKKTTNID